MPIIITAVLGSAVWLLLRAASSDSDVEVSIAYAGVVVALGVAFTGAWSRWRTHDYERVSEAVSGLVAAWQALDAQTGISWALWANFRSVYGLGWRHREEREQVEAAVAELLTLGAVERPASQDEHRWWRQNRYDKTYAVNKMLVTGRAAERHRDRFKREAVITSQERFLEARAGWDQAVAHLRATAARQEAILARVQDVEDRVRYWWLHAVNDPFYWDTDANVFEMRARMFRDAKTAVYDLRDAVQTRQLGHGPLRYWSSRILHGRDRRP